MKKLLLLLLGVLFLALGSCKNNSKTNMESEITEITKPNGSEVSEKNESLQTVDDCDAFLDQFEDWSNNFASFVEKYKEDPAKMVADPQYGQLMLKATSFSSNWVTLAASCATNPNYEKRYLEISDRMDKRMKVIGIGN